MFHSLNFMNSFSLYLGNKQAKGKKKTTTNNEIKDNYEKAQPTQTQVHTNKNN